MGPLRRLLDFLIDAGRIRPIPLSTFHFLLTHGAGAPFTLDPLAQKFSKIDPRASTDAAAHAELCADFIVRGLKIDPAPPSAPRKTTPRRK